MALAPIPDDEIEESLAGDGPLLALRAVVERVLLAGADRDEVVRQLGSTVLRLRTAGRERDEDVVTEVLDFVEGFSSPHMKL